ncbi:MAG: branched-chain amino acid ABC transporter permease [Actinobacteria bacterium]|nr:branched-chain amino acid ABC transporter permease [Actinomycetota bacterium]
MSDPRNFWRRNWGFMLLAVLALALPSFLADVYLLSILAFMATRFMVVVGLGLLLGQAGQISLGHAAFVAIGAYGSALLVTRLHVNPWLAMAMAAVLAAGVAGIIGVPTLKLKGHYLAMATLGFGEIVFILLVQLKGLTRGTDGITGIPPLTLGPLNFSNPRLYHVLVWVVALVVFRLALNLSESRVGRSLKALRRSELAAESLGVNTSWRKLQVFMISAVFASLAGSFDAHYVQFISPEAYTITFSVILVCSVVIGGFRSVWGALWGTLATVILPEIIKRIDEDAVNLVFGVLLILIVVLLPVKSGPLARVARDVSGLLRRGERS